MYDNKILRAPWCYAEPGKSGCESGSPILSFGPSLAIISSPNPG